MRSRGTSSCPSALLVVVSERALETPAIEAGNPRIPNPRHGRPHEALLREQVEGCGVGNHIPSLERDRPLPEDRLDLPAGGHSGTG